MASTFLDIKTAVAQKLRLNLADDGAKIGDWINKAYLDASSETRCFQQNADAVMTAGVDSYTLDPSILHIELVTVTTAGQGAFYPLKECQLDEILNFRANSIDETGPSTRYCLVGMNQLEVWPTPQDADTMTFYYSVLPDELAGDSDVPQIVEPFGSRLLEYGALVEGSEFKRDIMVLGQYQAQYGTWLAAFQRYVNRKGGTYPEAFPTWTRLKPYAPHDPSTDVPSYDMSVR